MVRCNFVSLFRVKHFLVLTCGFVVAKREGFSFIFLRFLLHSQGCIAKCLQGSEFSFTGWLKLTLPQYISGVRHLKLVEFPPLPPTDAALFIVRSSVIMHSAENAIAICLSVPPSATRRYCVETANFVDSCVARCVGRVHCRMHTA